MAQHPPPNQENAPNERATLDWLWILFAILWTVAATFWAAKSPEGLSFESFVLGFIGLAGLKYLIRFKP